MGEGRGLETPTRGTISRNVRDMWGRGCRRVPGRRRKRRELRKTGEWSRKEVKGAEGESEGYSAEGRVEGESGERA